MPAEASSEVLASLQGLTLDAVPPAVPPGAAPRCRQHSADGVIPRPGSYRGMMASATAAGGVLPPRPPVDGVTHGEACGDTGHVLPCCGAAECDDKALPMFRDYVKRSSRFTTAVPAGEILTRIADVVAMSSPIAAATPSTPSTPTSPAPQAAVAAPSANSLPVPVPASGVVGGVTQHRGESATATPSASTSPASESSSRSSVTSHGSNVEVRTFEDTSGHALQIRITWHEHQLQVLRDGISVCTVQVYLVRPGLYMVDFQRGMMDIFDFKRFYEQLRFHLTEIVAADYDAFGRLSALDIAYTRR